MTMKTQQLIRIAIGHRHRDDFMKISGHHHFLNKLDDENRKLRYENCCK